MSDFSKARFRDRLLAARRALSPEARAEYSARILEKVRVRGEWQTARCLGLYASLPDEVASGPILQAALAEGKIVALPRIIPVGRRLEFHRFRTEAELVPGPLGIRQPRGSESPEPLDLDLVILPGIGFDLAGNRLGFGGGYFDGFLAGFSGGTIGLAFDLQIVDALPVESYDRPVQCVISERRVLEIARKEGPAPGRRSLQGNHRFP